MTTPPELSRKSYLQRWLALTGAALVASVGVVFATRGTRGETLVLGVWAAWFLIKLVLLDGPRLRNMGWNERLAVVSLFLPAGIYLQARLFFSVGRRGVRVVATDATAVTAARTGAARGELGPVLKYYQAQGLLVGMNAEEIAARHREKLGCEPKAETPWDEIFLLSLDRERTWTGDPEADVCATNQVYRTVLAEWSRISGGRFVPAEIVEKWESEAGPVLVTFVVEGNSASVSPQVRDDWIDLDVLGELNFFTVMSGWKFNYAVDGNFCLVTFLPIEVERRLKRERQLPLVLK